MFPFLLSAGALLAATPFEEEIARWRRARELTLTADGGWLTVTGRFWLHEGINRVGSAASNDIVLPDGPPHVGGIRLDSGQVTLEIGGSSRLMRPNSGEEFRIGRVGLSLLGRAGAYSIRLKDPQSRFRRDFHGIDCYPPREEYRVTARFVASPRRIGDADSPGYVVFQLLGREFRLYPFLERPDAKVLMIVFRDRTTGGETYPGGRFLDIPLPRDGQIVLDFNKAYNPPCAFTPYVSCPLPPRLNRLPVSIEAGEKNYRH